jgi:hypothetical protein
LFLNFFKEEKEKMNSQKSNTVEVIGAGYGRTGTSTLKKALEILGYDPTYHMYEVVVNRRKHPNFWVRVSDKEPVDFDEIFCENGKPKYRATCDLPSSLYWKEQLDQYPEAKVILTFRNAEKWYKSCMDTIFHVIYGSPHQYFGLYLLDRLGLGVVNKEFWMKVVCRDAFRNNWSKENLIACYSEHNDKVQSECPHEKLLVFRVEQGWEPLCKFLGKPIPAEPFPHINDTVHFQRTFSLISCLGYVAVGGLVLLPVGAGVAFYKWRK